MFQRDLRLINITQSDTLTIQSYILKEEQLLLNTIATQILRSDIWSYLHMQLQGDVKTPQISSMGFLSCICCSLHCLAKHCSNKTHHTQQSNFYAKSQQINIKHNKMFQILTSISWQNKKSSPTLTKQIPPFSKWVVLLVTCFAPVLSLFSASLRIRFLKL